MKIKLSWLAIVVWSVIIFTSCDSSSLCLSGQHAIQSGLYSGISGEAKDTTLSGFYLWGIDPVTGENKDLLLDSARVSEMYMPTDIDRDSTRLIIREQTVASDLQDTLLFIYKRELNYVSGDCGFSYNLELDTVIHTINFIDSVVISYSSVLYNENLQNVQIFIEP